MIWQGVTTPGHLGSDLAKSYTSFSQASTASGNSHLFTFALNITACRKLKILGSSENTGFACCRDIKVDIFHEKFIFFDFFTFRFTPEVNFSMGSRACFSKYQKRHLPLQDVVKHVILHVFYGLKPHQKSHFRRETKNWNHAPSQ